ncbi:hypothetical protein RE428_47410 [Marinobacter nanhaiticus D15-8W]|uniref:Uncharacterized protein n=1 Tax=Marinobacter nanhaiticus D15-8W TaxID=626887 RepID=N6X2W5_9GAMM|nr:hypothetical protein J057_08756 [Marinobacter nanhaiticus D15-8W]BES73723.1 hypothetical protein RE428_47410 [Marinobacter nanhaiticus D15-8W]
MRRVTAKFRKPTWLATSNTQPWRACGARKERTCIGNFPFTSASMNGTFAMKVIFIKGAGRKVA